MTASSLWPYESPDNHEGVSAIIRRRSTNHADVRDVALQDLDLSFAESVLDLGCGFGFMEDALGKRVSRHATFVGVDAWSANETPFLEKVKRNGRAGRFVCMKLDSELPWPKASFDLVVCSYSLYFFVGMLPEVARVLTPHGLFLTITHSEQRLMGQLPEAGFAAAGSAFLSLVRKFSAENGRGLLEPWFGEVTQIPYENSLRFEPEHAGELLAYLKFKLPLLVPGSRPGDDLPATLVRFAEQLLSNTGEVVVDKDDAIFRCRSPLCR